MLEGLLGSVNAERVLLFIHARKESHASEIARFHGSAVSPIQHHLARLEQAGILVSKMTGKTRVFTMNPRYPFLKELQQLLQKALEFLQVADREALVHIRRRPRRKGKPL